MRRILGGLAVAMGVTATVAIGQTMLGRELWVLAIGQEYAAGNDTWPFQLVLLTWFIVNAVVLGCAAARPIVGEARWRHLIAVAAGLAALAPISLVRGWAGGATSVADPTLAATLAMLAGTVVGVAAGMAVLAWPGIGRNATIWAVWVWITILLRVVTDDFGLVIQADPLGVPAVQPLWRSEIGAVLAVLSPLPLCAVLGWLAKRRGDRLPVLGAVSGPLLLIAAHLVVFELPGSRIDGDHYSLPSDLAVWMFVAVVGCGAAALGMVVRRGAGAPRDPTMTAPAILLVAAALLAAAALVLMWQSRGGWGQAGVAAFAFATAAAARRGKSLPPAAGAAVAVGGVVGLVLLALPFTEWPGVGSLPYIAVVLVVCALVGALARGVAGAAWFALAAGVLLLLPSPQANGLIATVIGVLAIAAAAAVIVVTRRQASQG